MRFQVERKRGKLRIWWNEALVDHGICLGYFLGLKQPVTRQEYRGNIYFAVQSE
jgi:hypothetical protein